MSLECVVSVVQREKLMANGLSKPKQKNDMSGKLFWKQLLRGVMENSVLKIYAKSLKNVCEGVLLNSFYKK